MSTKLAWGKGGGEYLIAKSISSLLNAPIVRDGNFSTVAHHHTQLLEIGEAKKIAALETESRAAAAAIVEIIDASKVERLAFNPDLAGVSGNRSDLVLLDGAGNVVAGISSKHGSTEKGSFRYNPNMTVSPITGSAYSTYTLNRLSTIWQQIYEQPRQRCRERRDLPLLLEAIADLELGEIYWSARQSLNTLLNNLTKVAFGSDPSMIELTFKWSKSGYTHKIETEFPKIVSIGEPKIKARNDRTVSRSLYIPAVTDDGQFFGLNIRFKNGNEHTHNETGTPKMFVKTSVTRKAI